MTEQDKLIYSMPLPRTELSDGDRIAYLERRVNYLDRTVDMHISIIGFMMIMWLLMAGGYGYLLFSR